MIKQEKDSEKISRLEFMKCSLRSVGTIALCPTILSAIASCGSDSDEDTTPALTGDKVVLDLSQAAFTSLKTTGNTLRLTSSNATNVPSTALIVHRKSATEVLAFTGTCPHEQGNLQAQSSGSNIVQCDTHQGTFDNSGAGTNAIVSGNKLTAYTASVSGDTITISV